MHYWRLNQRPARGQIDLARATGLMAAIGHAGTAPFAAEVLKTLGAATHLSQCTLFAYEFGSRPRIVSVADHRGGRFLHDVADKYAKLYYVLDGNQKIISAAVPGKSDSVMLLHQQSSAEIEHDAYRLACYSDPNVCDRLSLLVQPANDIWLSLNLYRDRAHAHFQPADIERIEALAPLLGHAAMHHYALHGQSQLSIPQLMLAKLRGLCPDLSKREMDAVRGVLEGNTAAEIAERMGVKPSSVITYQKRAYQRLGISSQRQLFALCLSSAQA